MGRPGHAGRGGTLHAPLGRVAIGWGISIMTRKELETLLRRVFREELSRLDARTLQTASREDTECER